MIGPRLLSFSSDKGIAQTRLFFLDAFSHQNVHAYLSEIELVIEAMGVSSFSRIEDQLSDTLE